MRFLKRVFLWIKEEPIKGVIFLCVLGAHVTLFITLAASSLQKRVLSSKKHLHAQTVRIAPSKKSVSPKVASGTKAAPSKPSPKPKTPPKPPPQPKPAPAPAKKSAPPAKKSLPEKKRPPIVDKSPSKEKKKPPPKKEPSPAEEPEANIPKDLWQELEKSLARAEGPPQKTRGHQKSVPAPLSSSQEETSLESGAEEYSSLLVSCLHDALHLPEYGEVKMELTLRRDGTVAKLVVIKTESERNRKYLEQELPHLKLPYLDDRIFPNKQHTFILTFCNEI